MSIREFQFELNAHSPLLMHADDVVQADRMEAWRKAPENKKISRPGDDRSPAWTWSTYLYHDKTNVVMPSDNISVALRAAASQIILRKQTTFKQSTQNGMQIGNEYCKFECSVDGKQYKQVSLETIQKIVDMDTFDQQSEAVSKHGFQLFVKRAKIGAAKHIRVRPRFDFWRVTGTLSVVAPEITDEIVAQFFELAGKVGLCDWRPGCKTPGPYGQFTSKVTRLS